jgi:hypothetical protein
VPRLRSGLNMSAAHAQNTGFTRRTPAATARANVIVLRQYRQSGWSRFIRRAYAHQPSSDLSNCSHPGFDHRDADDTHRKSKRGARIAYRLLAEEPEPGCGFKLVWRWETSPNELDLLRNGFIMQCRLTSLALLEDACAFLHQCPTRPQESLYPVAS